MKREEYVKAVKAAQTIIDSGKHDACTCINLACPWHGKCFECVMIHRVNKQHVPECLQPILKDKIAALARTVELETVDAHPPQALRRQAKAILAGKKK